VAKKLGLGKGLDALLSAQAEEFVDAPAVPSEGGGAPPDAALVIVPIPLEKIRANPEQARKTFDEGELAELADSIREHGVINPIIVEGEEDGNYRIVAGERRFRAAALGGLKEIPALIRSYSDEKRVLVSLIENVQRADLRPIEEASAYRNIMDLTGLSQDEVAARVGKNRATVANSLRLLKLPPRIQESLQQGEISPGHGRALLSVEDPENQETLFQRILRENLSVREAERQAALLNGGRKRAKPEAPHRQVRAPELAAMEEKFLRRLGTKAVIRGDLHRGTILVDYYSMEDLERLYEILGGSERSSEGPINPPDPECSPSSGP